MIRSFKNPTIRLQHTDYMAKSPLLLALGIFLIAGCDGGAVYESTYEPDMVVTEEPRVVTEIPRIAAHVTRAPAPRRGVITAGDIDDTLNLAAFRSYQARASRMLGLPRMNLGSAVLAQLVGPDGKPAPGVPITLRKRGNKQPFYTGYSGVDGRITVFPSTFGRGALKKVELRAFGQNQNRVSHTLATGHAQKITLPFDSRWSPDFLDLVFVIDTTGSMGDELAWLRSEFSDIVQQAHKAAPKANIRFGLVAYRDRGDAYVVRNFGFASRPPQMQGWLKNLSANGGGDYPEAAAEAMQAAANLKWRRGKGERLLFHIADAPPHQNRANAYARAADQLAAKNVQVFGLGASGVADESELLMRQAALKTGGRYLFLTDDSGVGYTHAEPKIACYRVSSLRSLLIRVLSSELSGKRHEARRSDIIREVGNYRKGVCLQ